MFMQKKVNHLALYLLYFKLLHISDTLKAVDDNPNTDDKDTGMYNDYAS